MTAVDDRVTSRDEARALSRGDGVVSHILHGDRDSVPDDTDLTVTWVTVDAGAAQVPHSHEPEQVYVVVAGTGRMLLGDEERDVEAGDLVHVPSGTRHGIANTGDEPIEYVSAATPAFASEQVEAFYDA